MKRKFDASCLLDGVPTELKRGEPLPAGYKFVGMEESVDGKLRYGKLWSPSFNLPCYEKVEDSNETD